MPNNITPQAADDVKTETKGGGGHFTPAEVTITTHPPKVLIGRVIRPPSGDLGAKG